MTAHKPVAEADLVVMRNDLMSASFATPSEFRRYAVTALKNQNHLIAEVRRQTEQIRVLQQALTDLRPFHHKDAHAVIDEALGWTQCSACMRRVDDGKISNDGLCADCHLRITGVELREVKLEFPDGNPGDGFPF